MIRVHYFKKLIFKQEKLAQVANHNATRYNSFNNSDAMYHQVTALSCWNVRR